jgi:type II secretory pathway component GspD/PulD (secretin)
MSGNVNAFLNALDKTSDYDLIATPWITAVNNQVAEILIGQKLGFRKTLTTQTGTLQDIEFLEVGTKLKFLPHISPDGYIRMEIYPAVSDGVFNGDIPSENTTETKNQVVVKDGQTIVIGGLTKEYKTKAVVGVPIISQIPLLGSFFKKTELVSEKRDLMIIITPHIMNTEFIEKMNQKAKDIEDKGKEEIKDKNYIF